MDRKKTSRVKPQARKRAQRQNSTAIFISLTHSDTAIADALRDLLYELCGNNVVVQYSTNKEHDGSIRPGEDWLQWIQDRVREAHACFILLTPSSIQKPWILWEAGAVSGAAIAKSAEHGRRVRPLIFQLEQSEVPSPFHNIQGTRGDSKDDMTHMLVDLLVSLTAGSQGVAAGRKLDAALAKYLEVVEKALLSAPLLPTEAAVQEWCLRLDELKAQNRMSEVAHLHDWLNVAFGRDREGIPRAIDVRIHRRLGQLYLGARVYPKAAEQFELARQSAPRDIFVLRTLGQAYLGQGNLDRATEIVDLIAALDSKAFERNVECATLRGRLHRANKDLTAARDVYRKAFSSNPRSYYLADLIAQMELELGHEDDAKEAYRHALKIIEDIGEDNIWVHATAATAALANGDDTKAAAHLQRINLAGPSSEETQSIVDGLQRVVAALAVNQTRAAPLLSILRTAVPQLS